MCNIGFTEAFGGKLFNFMLLSLGFLFLFPSPSTPLRFHPFVAIHSIMLAIGSVGQLRKVACAIEV